nr:hypothetical protein [Tanacetum cinerariifolium]
TVVANSTTEAEYVAASSCCGERKEAEVSDDESEDEDHVPTHSSDPLPSGEDSFILNELMVFCTILQEQVLNLQEAKDAQAKEIVALKKKVTKLNKWRKSRSKGLRRLKKFGLETALDDETQGRINDDEMFGVDDLVGEEVVMDTTTDEHEEKIIEDKEMSTTIPAAATIVTTAVPTPRAKGTIFHEQKQSKIPTVSSSKDKGKAKMIEPEVRIKKKNQMRIDEEYARRLEAKEQEAARLNRAQKDEEANNSWDNIQAMMDADRLLAERLQAKEREEFSEVQKARLEMRKVNDFIAMDSKAQESILDDGEEVLIEATPLSSRSPTIIDYKIHKEGKKTYFKIIRTDVKDKFKKEKPVDDMNNLLFRTLKTMFEHHVEEHILKYQQGLAKVKNWKLFESCGVYYITMQSTIYYLLVEKVYPLTRNTLHQLWSDVRLQVDYDVEMAYDLLRFIRK